MCHLQMTFKRPATDRTLTFKEISQATGLPMNEVGPLMLMLSCLIVLITYSQSATCDKFELPVLL